MINYSNGSQLHLKYKLFDYTVFYEDPIKIPLNYKIVIINENCLHCANHPFNGGSGICHCILGSPIIY